MMRPQLRAALWLSATFVVGIALGMVLNGFLAHRGDRPAPPPNGQLGFVAEMERAIQPHDDAQRNQLHPFLTAADSMNRSIVDGARQSMGAAMDSLRARIGPLLDDEQRKRIAEIGAPMRGGGRDDDGRGNPPGLGGGRGRGGRGGRGGPGGPRGEGPPPDGRGGPPPH
ncbi:MAG: hypothetical protein ABJB66_12195 [Gemmatimonadaceae bacterium]